MPSPLGVATSPPLHGYRGDTAPPPRPPKPKGLTVAVSRQAGARGGSVAKRAAQLLGWQSFDQEALDYLTRDETARAELLHDLPAGAKDWADAQATRLSVGKNWGPGSPTADMVRLILTLAARGEVVIVGRGAGFLLPAETTVHVRVVAPLEQRVAYLSDLLRLPPAEAAVEVHDRDRGRESFIAGVVAVDPADAGGYDLVLNTGRLGEFAAAGLIVQAVVGRMAAAAGGSSGEFELP
jgi:hypothetical protein